MNKKVYHAFRCAFTVHCATVREATAQTTMRIPDVVIIMSY